MELEQVHVQKSLPTINVLNSLIDPKSKDKFKETFQDTKGLLFALSTDAENGIAASNESINMRISNFGNNTMPPPKMKSFLGFVFEAAKDRMVELLLVASVVTVGFGIYQTIQGESNAWLEGVAIVIAILIITGVNSVNDWRKQARFKQLNDKSRDLKSVKIIRDGEPLQVPTTELLVGDIMFLSMGDVVSCDGVLVEGRYLKTDESAMTGESDQINKETLEKSSSDSDPFLLSGTTVIDGSGRMVITSVGVNSVQGRMMMDLRLESPSTPLQIKLDRLAKKLATWGLIFALLTISILLLIFFLKGSPGDILEGLIDILLIGISIIVMAIPEGLPLAVTLSLAYATINMLKDNNLVRHLSACETMGGATTICSDKTGTLTVNKMKVVKMFLFSKDYDRSATEKLDAKKVFENKDADSDLAMERLVENITINSEAYEAQVKGVEQFIGSKTDVALLQLMQNLGYDYRAFRKRAKITSQIPFSSERKRMTTSVKYDNEDITFTKGASEIILELCTHYIDQNGKIQVLTEHFKTQVVDKIRQFAEESLRTISVAFTTEKTDVNYVLVGLFGIEDPLRHNAKSAVESCKKAGVTVRMVTGDNMITARSIAVQCGIITEDEASSPDSIVVEGPTFREMSKDEQKEICKTLRVMARSSPKDKLLLVECLKESGEVVAVTGDGANDGPALKSSNVGFSMGLSGTEVAKEASDIVLLDDNFESLVKSISWGRAVYTGIQKFITFQLSVNISAVIITVSTAFVSSLRTGIPIGALTTLQILFVNLVSDSLAAMALSTDKPTAALLERPPVSPTAHIITNNMWKMIIGQSVYQIGASLCIYYVGPLIFSELHNEEIKSTFVFNAFVYMVLFNELNCRSVTRDFNIFRGIGWRHNKFFLPLFIAGLALQFVIVTYLGIIFDTRPLSLLFWGLSILFGLGSLVVGVVIRFFFTE